VLGNTLGRGVVSYRVPIGRDHGVGNATVNEPRPMSWAGATDLGGSSCPKL
jgi:hypothetical protein